MNSQNTSSLLKLKLMSNYSKANNGIQINLDTQMIDILAAHFLLHMFYKSSLHSFIKMNLLNLG